MTEPGSARPRPRWPRAWWLLLAWACLLPVAGPAAESGDSVVVVYNQRDRDSERIAKHYAGRRRVPASQVWGLDLPVTEEISRATFQRELERPLLERLQRGGLFQPVKTGRPQIRLMPSTAVAGATIRYLVLCRGVPLRVAHDPAWPEPAGTNAAVSKNTAAVDAELALLPLGGRYPRNGFLTNWFLGVPQPQLLHPTNGVLMVSRLDGPTPEIANRLVDLAIAAETNGLWGRGWFDARGIAAGGYLQGDHWIRQAASNHLEQGFEVYLDDEPEIFAPRMALDHIAFYAGWYTTDCAGAFLFPGVEFMPGAFAYHLHSYSAATLRSTNRHWAGPLLARGATVTMGSVDEPFLVGTPDIPIFHRHLFQTGASFGEAAYLAQGLLSWQTTVVGDPLYRPFGRNMDWWESILADRRDPAVAWPRLARLNRARQQGLPAEVALREFARIDPERQNPVVLENLAFLQQQRGLRRECIATLERALEVSRSVPQRLRLYQTLLGELIAADQSTAALKLGDQALAELPQHPARASLAALLLPVARKLDRAADVVRYQYEFNQYQPAPAARP